MLDRMYKEYPTGEAPERFDGASMGETAFTRFADDLMW
jgi:hypothetical protein